MTFYNFFFIISKPRKCWPIRNCALIISRYLQYKYSHEVHAHTCSNPTWYAYKSSNSSLFLKNNVICKKIDTGIYRPTSLHVPSRLPRVGLHDSSCSLFI